MQTISCRSAHRTRPRKGPAPASGTARGLPPPPALGPRARRQAGRARPYLFQVALAQARRCCVPRSSAAAAAGSLLPRSLRLGELMNFNLRRVLIVTPGARSAPTRARRRSLRHAAGPGRRCALYEETWERAGSRAALRGPAPAPRPRPGPGADRPSRLIIAPSGGSVQSQKRGRQHRPGANRGWGRGHGRGRDGGAGFEARGGAGERAGLGRASSKGAYA